MVSGNPSTEYILNQIDDRNQIINYAIENRLERPTLDFLIKYKNKKCLINNLLKKNTNKRNLKSYSKGWENYCGHKAGTTCGLFSPLPSFGR